jgi:hypothetical protein
MTYRFAICDDEPNQLALVNNIVIEWARVRDYLVKLSASSAVSNPRKIIGSR